MTPMEAGMQGGMQGAALGILMATGFVFLFIGALIYRYLKEKTAQARKLIFPLDPANDDLYAKALAEVKNDQAEQGLWARCLIGANGDRDKATALYIKRRAAQLDKEQTETQDTVSPVPPAIEVHVPSPEPDDSIATYSGFGPAGIFVLLVVGVLIVGGLIIFET